MSIITAAAAAVISTTQAGKNNDVLAEELVTAMLAGAINSAAQQGQRFVQFDTRSVAKNIVARYGFGDQDVTQGVTIAVVIVVNPGTSLSFYDLSPVEINNINVLLGSKGYTVNYDPKTYTYLFQW